jgi:hypothetical protein
LLGLWLVGGGSVTPLHLRGGSLKMSGRNSFGSLPATESKSFLRKGQGNGVASGTAGKPTNRTLQLKKPETKDNDPTSYTGIYARQSAPRPVSAPNTPQKSRRQDAAKAGREAAELLLMGMEEGIFTSKCDFLADPFPAVVPHIVFLTVVEGAPPFLTLLTTVEPSSRLQPSILYLRDTQLEERSCGLLPQFAQQHPPGRLR